MNKAIPSYKHTLCCLILAAGLAACSDPVDPAPNFWAGRGTVAYTRELSLSSSGEIRTIDVDGSADRKCADGVVPCRLRNRRIVVARGLVPTIPWSLSLESLDGSIPPVTVASGSGSPPLVFGVVAVTADASHVAYLLGDKFLRPESLTLLYVASTSGGVPVLVSDSIVYSTVPVFSPDGSRLAFYAGSAKDQIAVADLSTGDVTIIARNAQPWTIENLDWSAATDRIVYVGTSGTRHDLFTMNQDGSDVRNLTGTLGGDNRWPTWSPDGGRIAFIRDDELWTINADGTGARQITQPSVNAYRLKMYPAWSPDGTMIVYTAIAANGLQGLLQVVDLATLRVNALAVNAARGFWVE